MFSQRDIASNPIFNPSSLSQLRHYSNPWGFVKKWHFLTIFKILQCWRGHLIGQYNNTTIGGPPQASKAKAIAFKVPIRYYLYSKSYNDYCELYFASLIIYIHKFSNSTWPPSWPGICAITESEKKYSIQFIIQGSNVQQKNSGQTKLNRLFQKQWPLWGW